MHSPLVIVEVSSSAHQSSAPPAGSAPQITLNTARLAEIVGAQGEQTGAVYKFTRGRNDLKVTEMGASINARKGLNTWAAFTGTNEKAAIAGDVAMLESEVTPVLKALRKNGGQTGDGFHRRRSANKANRAAPRLDDATC